MPVATLNPLWPQPAPASAGTCGDCVWRWRDGDQDRCRRHRDADVRLEWPACAAWTAALDCQTCGACCREAYHAVEVEDDDPFLIHHPELVVQEDGRSNVRRAGPRCAALHGTEGSWGCVVYETRPHTCRDFERGGENCVIARRRVGLTP